MKIDVIVPVYNAFEVLQKCLESLEKFKSDINDIIIINDASSDVRVSPYLDIVSRKNNWKIIHQTKNKGFVKTANKGLKLSNNHTVLLNSDTVVTKYWIKAFKRALKVNPSLGTATPWSNNAEICSFPQFLTNHDIPIQLDQLSKILYKKHRPIYPVIPTAVGFCMLISKKAKQWVGYLDEEHFGHGYGEENDYSLRIEQAGLKNILCDNAYVAHIGNQSFSDLGLKPSEKTMKRLLEKHPGYLEMIQEYINNDPLSGIREKIKEIIKVEGIIL